VIPTTRAAGAMAVIACLALVLPPGVSIALALILIGATLADAWSVRAAPVIARRVPGVVSRSVPVELTVSAETSDRRLLMRQPPGPELRVAEPDGTGTIATTVTATKRGLQTLPGVASASVGTLGLARVQHARTAAAEIRVLPNVVGAQRLIVRLRRSRTGLTGGRARGPLGLGTQFESVREYTSDDDIRNLNWRATARLNRPMSNQYRVERDRDVICVIDAGRLMTAPLENGSTVLDVALDAVTVVALAADELGDRFGALVFDDAVRRLALPRHHAGSATVRSLFDLQPRPVDSDFEAALTRVSRLRRAVVFVFTDLLD
jgi:uncharacterized protein (DUF58 family)